MGEGECEESKGGGGPPRAEADRGEDQIDAGRTGADGLPAGEEGPVEASDLSGTTVRIRKAGMAGRLHLDGEESAFLPAEQVDFDSGEGPVPCDEGPPLSFEDSGDVVFPHPAEGPPVRDRKGAARCGGLEVRSLQL